MDQVTLPDSATARPDEEQRVIDIVRALAVEVGGPRVASAVSATASLERDLGLGSLERVELLVRLEADLGRDLADGFLLLDTPREIALALASSDAGARTAPAPAPEIRAIPAAALGDIRTLADAFAGRARLEPRRTHAWLVSGDSDEIVTYGVLWEGAGRIAAALHARGVKRGDRVALMLPTGLDFLQAFAGTIAAGAVAVPLYPPARLDRIGEYLERQARILSNADARILIAMPEATPVAGILRATVPALSEVVTVDPLRRAGDRSQRGEPFAPVADADEDDPALIQYTSGSTGDPRGVVLSHANILANIHAIGIGVDVRPTDVIVSWLPLYHDMGLIGAWLSAIVWGIPIALMSPLQFLQRPERWLRAIDRHRGTLTAAPNFAFELAVRKVHDEAVDGLDLSTWRCALNGAEPVNPGTLDRFAGRFARYGFRREALMPVYGLAECSVALCFPPRGRAPLVDRVAREPFERDGRATTAAPDDATALRFVSVGRPLAGHEVRIVDERKREVGDRTVGRIVFRGPSAMREYWRNPIATADAISDGWVDSGDLGYRSGAELFITGRRKDVIIKAGRNLVPQEIEDVAATVAGVRKGCVVAFGVADEATGTERLVVLAESRARARDEHSRLEQSVRATVAAAVGLPPDTVIIVAPGTVPKTPSGKIRRNAARALFLKGVPGSPVGPPAALRARLIALAIPRAARALGRSVARGLYAVYLALVSAVATLLLGPPLAALLFMLPPGRPVRALSRIVAGLLFAITGCRLAVRGRGRLPRRGPMVLVANHASYADVPAILAALPSDVLVVAMREIDSWKFVGAFVRRGRHPTVDRWQAKQSVADSGAIQEHVRAGHAVLFFPEGKLGTGEELGPLRLGAFETAIAAGAPVVPVAIRGAHRVLRHGTRLPRPGLVEVIIGEPIAPEGGGWRAVVALRDRTAAALASL